MPYLGREVVAPLLSGLAAMRRAPHVPATGDRDDPLARQAGDRQAAVERAGRSGRRDLSGPVATI